MEASGRARVVVADDHPRILDAVTAILAPTFDVVASAPDGAAAIDATLRLDPDVVVLDIAMPGIDGFQTASRIKASGSRARVVFLSNHAGDDFVLAGMSRGASAFVAKMRMHLDLVEAVGHGLAGRAFLPSAAVLPLWSRPAGRRHDLQMYGTDAFLIDAVMAFFDSALEIGNSIMAIASESHLHALDAQLRARGLDVASLIARGRYSRMDSASALDAVCLDGTPDRALWAGAIDPPLERGIAASTASPPHVSLFGEIAPILCARGAFDAMVRLERIAGEYAASRPVSILCGYSTASVAAGVSASICAEHATIVPAGSNA